MATTVPSSSFAICLTDPMGEEATSPIRDTEIHGGSMSTRHKRKHAALQDTAESPPAAVIDPLVGLDRPSRHTRNAAAPCPLEAANTEVVPNRVSKRLSMKVEEPVSMPVSKKALPLAKTARIAAAKKAGPHPTNVAPVLPRVNENAVLDEEAERPRRAQKLPKRFDESILLDYTQVAPTTTAAPAPHAVKAKITQKVTAPHPVAIASKQKKNIAQIDSSSITLGCPRCRYAPKGCDRCKGWAAAAGANVEELIAAVERAKAALTNTSTVLPTKTVTKTAVQVSKKEMEKKKSSEEGDGTGRRVSARRQGIPAAAVDPIPTADVTKEKEPVTVAVIDAGVTERKRGRKSANKPTPAAAEVAEEPAAMEIEQPEGEVVAAAPSIPAEDQNMVVTNAQNTEKEVTEPKGDTAVEESKKIPSPSRQKKTDQVVVEEKQQQQHEDDEEEEPSPWWNPLDPSKVSQAQAALHVSSASIPGQELPLCRERQISAIDSWLADRLQTGQGGSMYLSGLPGTGKSLTALELVRRCGQHLSQETQIATTRAIKNENTKRGFALPPPALIAVNCMRFSEPKQAVERILAGYHTACRQVEGKEIDPLVQVPDEGAAEVVAHRRRGSSLGGGINTAALTPQELLRQIVLQPMPTVVPATGGTARQNQKKGGRRSSAAGGGGGGENGIKTGSTSTAVVGDGCGMIVAVLDELDGLLTGPRGDALVGELFALAHAPHSRLILIGIANSIDLVQQLMRPGGSLHRHNLRPEHEIFPAYLSSQVSELITQRLSRLPGPVFDPKTIQFCARKIANGSGDMRRALEACARAISIVATDEQKKAAATSNINSTGQNPTVTQTVSININQLGNQPVVVGMRHMAAALAQVTGGIGASNDSVNAIRKLPVPQQLLMATVAKLLGERMGNRGLAVKVPSAPGVGGASAASRFIGTAAIAQPLLDVSSEIPTTTTTGVHNTTTNKAYAPSTAIKRPRNSLADAHRRRSSSILASSKELTVGDLRAAHAGLCKRVGVGAYSQIEFNVAIDTLCTMGLVEVKGGAGKGPLQRVSLQIAEDDVLMALANVPVLKDVVGA